MAYESRNPATGEAYGSFATIGGDEISAAIARAHDAFLVWRERPVEERARVLATAADLMEAEKHALAVIATEEMGKLIGEAVSEVELSASILRYYASDAIAHLADEELPQNGEFSAVIRSEPLGVLLGVMPWNFPFYQVARFAGPNLLLGNTLLLKHASNCPRSALAFEDLLSRAGLLEGAYVNVFLSSSDVASVLADPRVAGVSLTGSEEAGMSVAEAAGRNIKKCVLELGGSDPFVVLDDHDLDEVVAVAAAARMVNAGQACTAAKRFIVVDDVFDRFAAGLVDRMGSYRAGDPRDESTTLAPLSSPGAVRELAEIIDDAVSKGARVLVGGGEVPEQSGYMEPTVLTGVTEGMRAYREELFGPVAVIHRAADADEALALANDSDFGLGAMVFTRDADTAERFARELQVGMVAINTRNRSTPDLPFGGIKRSGVGRELGKAGLEEFVNKKLVRTLVR